MTSSRSRSYGLLKCADLSLTEGVNFLEDPVLRKMLMPKAKKHEASGIYLYDGMLFFFKDNVVVTVYPIGWLGERQEAA